MPDWILSNVAKIVSPDWGELVGLIPLAVATIVALFLAWLVRRAVTAPPRHIGPHGAAAAPAATHGPGPSLAPLLVAFGAFCFFLALLFVQVGPRIDPGTKQQIPDSSAWTIQPFGVLALVIGILALAGGLLYWGREATRDYDALVRPRAVAIRAAAEPPPGVHVPGPSFRPLVVALAVSVLLLGLGRRHRDRRRRPRDARGRHARLAPRRAPRVRRGGARRPERPPGQHPGTPVPDRDPRDVRAHLRILGAGRDGPRPAAGRVRGRRRRDRLAGTRAGRLGRGGRGEPRPGWRDGADRGARCRWTGRRDARDRCGGRPVRQDRARGAGRQAVRHRLREQRRGDPSQRRDPQGLADRRRGLEGRDLQRRRDAGPTRSPPCLPAPTASSAACTRTWRGR